MDGGAWQATSLQGGKELDTTEGLHDFTFFLCPYRGIRVFIPHGVAQRKKRKIEHILQSD